MDGFASVGYIHQLNARKILKTTEQTTQECSSRHIIRLFALTRISQPDRRSKCSLISWPPGENQNQRRGAYARPALHPACSLPCTGDNANNQSGQRVRPPADCAVQILLFHRSLCAFSHRKLLKKRRASWKILRMFCDWTCHDRQNNGFRFGTQVESPSRRY